MFDYKIEKHDKQWNNAIKQLEKRKLLKPIPIAWDDIIRQSSTVRNSDYIHSQFVMSPKTAISLGHDINDMPCHIQLYYGEK